METIRGRMSLDLDLDGLKDRLASYNRIVLDFGTGDGRYVRTLAEKQPDWFKIGVDACRDSFFFLDEERRITRVVKHEADGIVQFDFTNFEGPDLQADLARRDFTVNAMAIDLKAFLAQGSPDGLIDPFNGREDIRQKLIRITDPKVLDDDPLRLLRAARFAATLGFSIEPGTAEHIRSRADLATKPSAERIRDEFFQIVSMSGAGRHLLLLESLGLLMKLLTELLPLRDFAPGKHHCYDIFTHSLKTAEYSDAVVGDLPLLIPEHAASVIGHLDEARNSLGREYWLVSLGARPDGAQGVCCRRL